MKQDESYLKLYQEKHRKKIRIRRLGPEGHVTQLLDYSKAFRELKEDLNFGRLIYAEDLRCLLRDKNELRLKLYQTKEIIVMPVVAGG